MEMHLHVDRKMVAKAQSRLQDPFEFSDKISDPEQKQQLEALKANNIKQNTLEKLDLIQA
jgi:hypothetical protein